MNQSSSTPPTDSQSPDTPPSDLYVSDPYVIDSNETPSYEPDDDMGPGVYLKR